LIFIRKKKMKLEFMLEALKSAENSGCDIPIGAVIVKDNKIIAKACNESEKMQSSSGHAEMFAIQRAETELQNRRLDGCEMYVTLEPCPMCAAAILYAKIQTVYFGAYDTLYGALGSKIDMREIMKMPLEAKGGIMEEKCSKILKDYFERLRLKK